MEDAHAGMTIFFENYYPNSKVEGFYIKKLSLEFLFFLGITRDNLYLKLEVDVCMFVCPTNFEQDQT